MNGHVSKRQEWFNPPRFTLNVSAGSQKRAIHEPEGRDESRLALKLKRTLNVTVLIYFVFIWTNPVTFGQTICLVLRTLCLKRFPGIQKNSE